MQFCQNSNFFGTNRKYSFNQEFNNKNFYDSNVNFDNSNLNMTNSDCKKQGGSKKVMASSSQKSDEIFHKINLEKVKLIFNYLDYQTTRKENNCNDKKYSEQVYLEVSL